MSKIRLHTENIYKLHLTELLGRFTAYRYFIVHKKKQKQIIFDYILFQYKIRVDLNVSAYFLWLFVVSGAILLM